MPHHEGWTHSTVIYQPVSVNLFAGARRLALITGGVILLLGIYASESDRPYLTRTDRSLSPDTGCLTPARSIEKEIRTPKGHTATLIVCYDLSVNRYNEIAARSKLRSLADTVDRRALDQEAAQQRWERRRESGQLALAACAALLVGTWAVGWIVRGFLGIPRGKDRRPTVPDGSTTTEGAT